MTVLYEYYKLVERNPATVSDAWKATHIALALGAFVFGGMCACCLQKLSEMFQDSCVLFPRSMQLCGHDEEYGIIAIERHRNTTKGNALVSDMLFIKTQWADSSVCYLPEYVPLLSAIFGVIWASMFLMCSTGGRVNSGLLRSWRIIPPAFLFSSVMALISLYTSIYTHHGLVQLLSKIEKTAGDEKYVGIRNVRRWAQLTQSSAWLHTACWVLSATVMAARVLLVVDFQLVRVRVTLHSDIDRILERREKELRVVTADTILSKSSFGVSPESQPLETVFQASTKTEASLRVQFRRKSGSGTPPSPRKKEFTARKVLSLANAGSRPSGMDVLGMRPRRSKTSADNYVREINRDQLLRSSSSRSSATGLPHLKDRLLIALDQDSAFSFNARAENLRQEEKDDEKRRDKNN